MENKKRKCRVCNKYLRKSNWGNHDYPIEDVHDSCAKKEFILCESFEKKIEKLREYFNKKLGVYDMRLTNDGKSVWLRSHEKKRLIDSLFEDGEDVEITSKTENLEDKHGSKN